MLIFMKIYIIIWKILLKYLLKKTEVYLISNKIDNKIAFYTKTGNAYAHYTGYVSQLSATGIKAAKTATNLTKNQKVIIKEYETHCLLED